MVRDHGSKVRYEHDVVGRNARMDELQAAILASSCATWTSGTRNGRANAAKLSAALAGTSLVLPTPGGDGSRRSSTSTSSSILSATGCARSWASAVCRRASTIPAHPPANAYADLAIEPGAFPIAERLSATVLSLPMYAELTDEQIERVAACVREFDSAGA